MSQAEALAHLVVVNVEGGRVTFSSPASSDVVFTRTVETHRMFTGRDAKVGETYRFRCVESLNGKPDFYYQSAGSFVNVEDEHSSFLAAIFAEPDDDTRRLAFADFLQERGEESRAAFIRYQCEVATLGWACQLCVGRQATGFCTCARGRAQELFAANAGDWAHALPGTGNRERLRIISERCEVIALWDTDSSITYTFRRGFAEISPDLPVEWIAAGRSVWRDADGPGGTRYNLTQLNERELTFGKILSGISNGGTVRVRIRESGEEYNFAPHQFVRSRKAQL